MPTLTLRTDPATARPARVESVVQVVILLAVGSMAGAASFTHVHDWTMQHSPPGTGDWFGWANAVTSELTPLAAGLEVRRRTRTGAPTRYPVAVLAAFALLSLGAQVARAKPSPSGWLLAALPAVGFLALTKLVLSRTLAAPATRPAVDARVPDGTPLHADPDPAGPPPPAPTSVSPARLRPPVPAAQLARARSAADQLTAAGHPVDPAALRDALGVSAGLATDLHAALTSNGHPANGRRPS